MTSGSTVGGTRNLNPVTKHIYDTDGTQRLPLCILVQAATASGLPDCLYPKLSCYLARRICKLRYPKPLAMWLQHT